jgi:hypothetical protein
MAFDINGNVIVDLQIKNFNTTTLVRDNLMLYLDAQVHSSYPGTGTSWYDLSGNGYDFTLVNSPTFGTYNGAQAFNFDGASDYATRAGSISHDIGSAGTITLMMSSIGNTNFGSCSRLFSVNDGSAVNNDHSTYFTLPSCDETRYGLWWNSSYGGIAGLYPTTVLKAVNDPYRIITYKWTANGSAYVFVNGIQEASGAIGSAFSYTNVGRMTIAMNSALTLENAYVRVAAVAMYNRALTSAEILQNYQYFRPRFEKYYNCGYGCSLYNYDPGCTIC